MKPSKNDKRSVQSILMPNYLIYIGKILQVISPKLASRFAARLFLTPFRFPTPKREQQMLNTAKQERIIIPSINREVVVYHYGNSSKRIMLCHGWSGSGTQLSKIAETLIEQGYSTISFDAPAHGKAKGKISMMPFFIESLKYLQEQYPYTIAIGHSLGGMSLLKAVNDGMYLDRLCIIGTANSITNITKDFIKHMQLQPKIAIYLKAYLDSKFEQNLDNYSGAVSAQNVNIPTLVIHDKDDVDVHYSSANEIVKVLSKGQIYLTNGLGHRRVLGDQTTITQISNFIKKSASK